LGRNDDEIRTAGTLAGAARAGKTDPIPPEMPGGDPAPEDMPTPTPHPTGPPAPVA
jgi:hypothetical protein